MLDQFREAADEVEETPEGAPIFPTLVRRPRRKRLALTAGQRLLLAALLFLLTVIFSAACLLLTGKIYLLGA
jgi:hypothetical protein